MREVSAVAIWKMQIGEWVPVELVSTIPQAGVPRCTKLGRGSGGGRRKPHGWRFKSRARLGGVR